MDKKNKLRNFLEKCIIKANSISFFNKKIVPYLLCLDIGFFATILLSYCLMLHFDSEKAAYFVFSYIIIYLLYELIYQKIKAKLLHVYSRSYLQDIILFIIPCFIIFFKLSGVVYSLGFDVIGLIFPLIMTFVRIGCFLGGCCYGIVHSNGVHYPDFIFKAHRGKCRNFSPGKTPPHRVLPIQLYEATFHFLCFITLSFYFYIYHVTGNILFMYLMVYSGFRFCSDFYRTESVRPRIGIFSEAQVFSMVVFMVSVLILIVKHYDLFHL